MTSDLHSVPQHTDRNAAMSFVAGLLTLLAVCIAILPVPLTGFVCFPAAAILGIAASVNGFRAMRRFKTLTRVEKGMTVAGLAASATGVLITAGSAVVTVVLGLRLVEAIRQLTR